MSYSTGPGGYGDQPQGQGPSSQGYGQQGYGASPGQGTGQSRPLSFFLNLGVVALGIISFFLGFAAFASQSDESSNDSGVFGKKSVDFFDNVSLGVGVISLTVLIAAALIAAFAMLPKQESHDVVVAGLSVAGFISLLFLFIGLSKGLDAGIGLILVLVTSFLQSALAIAVLLFASGVLKPPQPRQANYGYYGQPGYGQPQQPYYGAPGAPGTTPPSYQPPSSQPQPQQQQGQQPQPGQNPQNPQNPW